MKANYSTLMQSRFFSPAFNSAIFDGPIRIYFSQVHESLALKVYFSLQQKFADVMAECKLIQKQTGQNLLIMIYPTQETFALSFENRSDFLVQDNLEGDDIIAINGPFNDEQLLLVLNRVVSCFKDWKNAYNSQNGKISKPYSDEASLS